jgi:hypothetical protein
LFNNIIILSISNITSFNLTNIFIFTFFYLKDLEKKYFLLCKEEKLTPGEFFEQISDLKEQIKQFHLNNFKGSQIRSKAKFLDNSEKPNKYFFRIEIKKGKKKNISEIKTGEILQVLIFLLYKVKNISFLNLLSLYISLYFSLYNI